MTVCLILFFMLVNCRLVKAAEQLPPIDETELETFIDDFFKENMDKYHVPGTAIAFVKDEEICLMKGYGYADVENKKRVDPEKTLFGIASVSKLLTATAVMQQYEEGNIDLNKDINKYVKDIKIQEGFKAPITVGSLLTHTSGFNQSSIGIGTRDPSAIKELGEYLKTAIPKRAYEPNRFFSYSNQGMSLAGHIVELVSRKSFEDYMDDKVFMPLSMENSTFKQPIGKNMEAYKAVGYGYWSQKKSIFRTSPNYYQVSPAGACYTTVSDMAHFIIANLNEGSYNQTQLLKKNTMEEMHKQHFTHDSKMPGQAYGFWESFDHNQRALFHTGTSDGYASLLYIIPEQHIGFMLSYNLATDKLRSDFLQSFLDRFFPEAKKEAITPLKGYKERVNLFEGLYLNVEKPKFTLDKLEILMSDGLVRAKAQKDGSLKLTGYYGENMGSYIETEPEVFKNIDSGGIITFKQSASKQSYNELYIKNNAFLKVAWYENPTLFLGLAIFSLSIIIISPIVWIRGYIRKKEHGEKKIKSGQYGIHLGCFTTILIIVFCMVTAMVTAKLGKYAFMFGVPMSIKMILVIPILLCGTTLLLVVVSFFSWKDKYWTLAYRSFFILFTIAMIMFLAFLKFWNMIGVINQ